MNYMLKNKCELKSKIGTVRVELNFAFIHSVFVYNIVYFRLKSKEVTFDQKYPVIVNEILKAPRI